VHHRGARRRRRPTSGDLPVQPRRGAPVQVDPIRPKLKAPGTKRLTLKCDESLSSFAFKLNLRRHTAVRRAVHALSAGCRRALHADAKVGQCRLTPSNPR